MSLKTDTDQGAKAHPGLCLLSSGEWGRAEYWAGHRLVPPLAPVCVGESLDGTWPCALLAGVLSLGGESALRLRACARRSIQPCGCRWGIQVKGAGLSTAPSPPTQHGA